MHSRNDLSTQELPVTMYDEDDYMRSRGIADPAAEKEEHNNFDHYLLSPSQKYQHSENIVFENKRDSWAADVQHLAEQSYTDDKLIRMSTLRIEQRSSSGFDPSLVIKETEFLQGGAFIAASTPSSSPKKMDQQTSPEYGPSAISSTSSDKSPSKKAPSLTTSGSLSRRHHPGVDVSDVALSFLDGPMCLKKTVTPHGIKTELVAAPQQTGTACTTASCIHFDKGVHVCSQAECNDGILIGQVWRDRNSIALPDMSESTS